ncbi:MAG TPA: hypothetical protein VMN57_02470 [Anaerolineales bacterium]|nr:hypothetical protein [Anaerolineales bacterium]
MNTETSAPVKDDDDSPIKVWRSRFREDFQFVPGIWLPGLAGSLGACVHQFTIKLPRRLYFWGRGLVTGPKVVPGPLQAPEEVPQPPVLRRTGRWLVFAFLRTFDLVSGGELINFVEHLAKPNTRRLTETEIAEAKRVFGDGLPYGRVRIDEWSLIAHYGAWDYRRRRKKQAKDMAMTIYNTVHFSRRLNTGPGESDMDWLVHELTHIAQHEHAGGVFMAESLIAQGGQGYDYGGPDALAGRDFADFNREQQGDIAKDYYRILTNDKTVTDPERAEYERVIDQLRSGNI